MSLPLASASALDASTPSVSSPEAQCLLLGVFGLLVQLCLAACVCSFVLAKWYFEAWIYGSRRRLAVFLLDISKQAVGASFVHLLNVSQAILVQRTMQDVEEGNQCVWYLIGLVQDCVFSTVFCAMAMDRLRPVLLRRYGMDVGNYESFEGDARVADELREDEHRGGARYRGGHSNSSLAEPIFHPEVAKPRSSSFNPREWLLQTLVWCLIVLVVRLALMVPVLLCHATLYDSVKSAVFAGMDGKAQMVTALVVAPLVGNMFQFAVVDHFLRKKT